MDSLICFEKIRVTAITGMMVTTARPNIRLCSEFMPVEMLYSISTGMNSEHNLMFGLAVVTIIPVMAVTLIFSKQIKESIANAGIKG